MARISKIINNKIDFNGVNSWVDFGTGDGTVVKELKWNRIAKYKYAIEKYKQEIGDNWQFVDNLEDLFINDNKYDLFTAFDCIEHLTKEDGLNLLKYIEDKFNKKLFFTPRGFLRQDETTHPKLISENPWQKHISGWDENDFKKFNYETIILSDFHKPSGYNKQFDALMAYKINK